MNFSKLRHRIIFLQPTDLITNSMGETVPRYTPIKPGLIVPYKVDSDKVYLTYDNDGNALLKYVDGRQYANKMALKDFSVAGLVVPMTGREYEESQKLRAETTYKISTRFFPRITQDMRILYNNCEFEIVSVLDLNGRHEELEIVAAQTGIKTAQNFAEDTDGE